MGYELKMLTKIFRDNSPQPNHIMYLYNTINSLVANRHNYTQAHLQVKYSIYIHCTCSPVHYKRYSKIWHKSGYPTCKCICNDIKGHVTHCYVHVGGGKSNNPLSESSAVPLEVLNLQPALTSCQDTRSVQDYSIKVGTQYIVLPHRTVLQRLYPRNHS